MPSQSDLLTVYVVEKGCYDERYIAGIYRTPEAAMTAHPVPASPAQVGRSPSTIEREGGWQEDEHGRWDNGRDWQDAASIYPMEVEG